MMCRMPRLNRRTATRVRDGRVQKKNNWRPDRATTARCLRMTSGLSAAVRPRAIGISVTVAQLREFLGLLPDWEEAAIGLRAIVLDSDTDCYGWYQSGVVAICNWEQDLWSVEAPEFVTSTRSSWPCSASSWYRSPSPTGFGT